MAWMLVLQLWTSLQSPGDGTLLHGHWEACQGEERAYDYCVLGKCRWSLHMGPNDEFAIYKHPEPDQDDHDSPLNLLGLGAGYHAGALDTWRGKRNWTIPSLSITLSVAQAGGSHCDGWYIMVRPLKLTGRPRLHPDDRAGKPSQPATVVKPGQPY